MRDCPWSWPRSNLPGSAFPNLTYGERANHRRRSWATRRYNCIAWAADDPEQWWWPESYDSYWPPTAINEMPRDGFISAFGSLGYAECVDKSLEAGFEKVAIYFDYKGVPTHAARQLATGKWTSKLGRFADIQHDQPEDVNCDTYGSPQCYLKRDRRQFRKPLLLRSLRRLRTIFYWTIYLAKYLKTVPRGGP